MKELDAGNKRPVYTQRTVSSAGGLACREVVWALDVLEVCVCVRSPPCTGRHPFRKVNRRVTRHIGNLFVFLYCYYPPQSLSHPLTISVALATCQTRHTARSPLLLFHLLSMTVTLYVENADTRTQKHNCIQSSPFWHSGSQSTGQVAED